MMTNNTPTEAELKKFWERCGLTYHFGETVTVSTYKRQNFYWEAPDGQRLFSLPTLTLDSLFRWAVPCLKNIPDFVLLQHQTFWHDNGEIHHDWIVSFGITKEWARRSGTDNALALYRALQEVLEQEIKQ